MPQNGQTKPQQAATAAISGVMVLCLLSASPVMAAGLDLPEQGIDGRDRSHTDTILPLGDKLWLGFGLSKPYAENAWDYVRFSADDESPVSAPSVASLSSTLGWQVNNQWALGIGLDVQHGEAGRANALHDALAVEGPGIMADSLSPLGTDSWDTAYKLGLQFSPSKQTRLGWHYRSAVSHSLKGGEASPLPTALSGNVESYRSPVNLKLPAITSLGITHQAAPRWTLLGQYNWVEWSRLDEQNITFSDGSYTLTDQNYRDSWSLSLGSEYRYDPQWTLRGGLQYSQTPAPKLMGDSTRLALGAAYRSNERLSVEMAYTHVLIKQQSLSMDRDYYQGLVDSDVSLPGRSSGNAHIFGLGLRYAF